MAAAADQDIEDGTDRRGSPACGGRGNRGLRLLQAGDCAAVNAQKMWMALVAEADTSAWLSGRWAACRARRPPRPGV